MSRLVEVNRGGLTRVQYEADEKALRDALRRLDPDLRLVWEVDDRHRARVYKVYKFVSESIPAVWICDWRGDDGEPLPLTSSLVEYVASLRGGSRRPVEDELAHNDALEERNRREWEEALAEHVREGERSMKRSPSIHPSRALMFARARGRRKGLSK